MHVVMISDHETAGGAAVAASRLADGLIAEGAQVTRVVGRAGGGEHAWQTRELQVRERRPSRWLRSVLSLEAGERVRQRNIRRHLASELRRLQPDVINVHNLHEAEWGPDVLRACRSVAPVVWTLHDMWSFTGRCVYNHGCGKFREGCDATCPTPQEYPALSPPRIYPAWQRRRILFSDWPDLCAVTPSRWLGDLARSALWRAHRVEVIPYGLDLSMYRPLDRETCRRELGVAGDEPVVLVSALDLADARKGMDLFVEALAALGERGPKVLAMGEGTLPGPNVISLGRLEGEFEKARAYNAADVFVHPAREDNLPNVLLESLACGTPIVAFAVGGVPDAVRPNRTGWLANEVSASALAESLREALVAPASLRESCRQTAERDYGLKVQAERYLSLFEDMLAR